MRFHNKSLDVVYKKKNLCVKFKCFTYKLEYKFLVLRTDLRIEMRVGGAISRHLSRSQKDYAIINIKTTL